jgi:GTP cyclohydrolase I
VSQPSAQQRRVESAIAELIRALGLDPRTEPELEKTPERVADFYAEILSGVSADAPPELATFPHEGDEHEAVIVRGLPFHSLCVHHFAPFFGTADIAYVPAGSIIGISGPARLLDHYARRPQLQERLTRQVADHLERLVAPRGIAVRIRARHLCMEMRGIRRRGLVETSVARGTMKSFSWS